MQRRVRSLMNPHSNSAQSAHAPARAGALHRMKDFASRLLEKSDKLTDKWEQYLSIYEVELAPYVCEGTPINLLEIGVQNGGSLELWSDYLPPGSQIVGIDIDSRVGELKFGNPNISVFAHDVTDAQGLRAILGNSTFDVIIDDGSHISSDVIKTFEFCFDYLAPGGKFIIEDLHASYYPSHGGGFRKPGSSIEWLKSVVDALNADHIEPGADMPEQERLLLKRLNTLISRVTFYDSVAIIEKLRVEKTRPYRRILGGLEASLVSPEEWLFKISPERLATILFAHPAARYVEPLLIQELSARQARIEELQAALQDTERQLVAMQARQLGDMNQELSVGDDTSDICARVLATATES
jgi:SAM-dependent methyltransferase